MRSPRNNIVFALLIAFTALPAGADAAAKKKAAEQKADKSRRRRRRAEPEVKLPPILLKALHEKEAQVTDARREAIGLIESYLRDSPTPRNRPRRSTSWPSCTGRSPRPSISRRWRSTRTR